MEKSVKLNEKDLLRSEDYPVITFFNAIPDINFIEVVERMAQGVGTGFNATICLFPNDLDPYEEKFEGVMFALHNEEVVIDNEAFLYYLRKACKKFLHQSSNKKIILDEILERINLNYLPKNDSI